MIGVHAFLHIVIQYSKAYALLLLIPVGTAVRCSLFIHTYSSFLKIVSKKADEDEPIGRLRYHGVLFHFLVLSQDYNDVIHIICIRNSRILFFKIHQAAFSGYHTDYDRGLNLFKAE